MPHLTISVLGGITQDLTTFTHRIPDDGETVHATAFAMQAGGKGANSAVACHRLTRPNPRNTANKPPPPPPVTDDTITPDDNDIQVRMIGAVGNSDGFGPALRQNLIDCGVNVDGVRVVDGQSGVATILVEAKSGANRIMQFPGAAYSIELSDFLTIESLGGGVRPDLVIAQLELRRDSVEQAIETAFKEGVEVLLNPSPAHYLMPEIYSMITHLVVNETEAVMLSDIKPDDIENQTGWTNVAEYFLGLGVKNVVVTLAEKGAYFSSEGGANGYVEAEKNCTVVDSSGAGDSFVGGYAAQYMAQKQEGRWDIRAAVQYGCKASARVIEHLGCLHPIPWADEVDIPASARQAEAEAAAATAVGPVAEGGGEAMQIDSKFAGH